MTRWYRPISGPQCRLPRTPRSASGRVNVDAPPQTTLRSCSQSTTSACGVKTRQWPKTVPAGCFEQSADLLTIPPSSPTGVSVTPPKDRRARWWSARPIHQTPIMSLSAQTTRMEQAMLHPCLPRPNLQGSRRAANRAVSRVLVTLRGIAPATVATRAGGEKWNATRWVAI